MTTFPDKNLYTFKYKSKRNYMQGVYCRPLSTPSADIMKHLPIFAVTLFSLIFRQQSRQLVYNPLLILSPLHLFTSNVQCTGNEVIVYTYAKTCPTSLSLLLVKIIHKLLVIISDFPVPYSFVPINNFL